MTALRQLAVLGTVACAALLLACAQPEQTEQTSPPAAIAAQREPQPAAQAEASPANEGICSRTPAVRDALVAALDGVDHCAAVIAQQLASIDGELDLSGAGIDRLRADDFNGLQNLRGLRLNDNRIRELPADLFAGLSGLRFLHLHDNPGAPFPITLRLIEGQFEPVSGIAVETSTIVPFAIEIRLINRYVALSQAFLRIEPGERYSSEAQTGGIFGAQAGRIRVADTTAVPADRCGGEACWRGLVIVADAADFIVRDSPREADSQQAPSAGSPCAGIPTQVIVLTLQTFARDERIVRHVAEHSGVCYTAVTISPDPEVEPAGACTITEYVTPISGGTRQSRDREGQCRWLQFQGSAGQGATPQASPVCGDLDALTLTANDETFNRSGRIDVVQFDPETRCYSFLSAAQDPNRAEAFVFSPDQECVFGRNRVPVGDCGEIVFWSGYGIGGVDNLAEAQTEVARIRPYRGGEEDAQRRALIEACQELTPLSLTADADSFSEQRVLHAISADPDELCFITLYLAVNPTTDQPRALAAGEQCTISAAFQLLGFPYLLPTTQTGDCEGLIHYARYWPAGGEASAEEITNLADNAAQQLAASSAAEWTELESQFFCLNDVCTFRPPAGEQDQEP